MMTTNNRRVSYLRHSGFVAPSDLSETANIIGCGAVGSHEAVLLAKMGFHKFRLWDADTVEAHNLPNQTYDIKHIRQLKVDALEDVLTRFNPEIQVEKHPYFFETNKHKSSLTGPVFIATDSMKSRYDIYDAFNMNYKIPVVVEVRLGFDYGEVHVIDNMNPMQCKAWYNTLQSDKSIPDGPCNLRICTTLVQLASSLAVHNVCEKFAALRQQVDWKYKTRTFLSLKNQLRIQSVN